METKKQRVERLRQMRKKYSLGEFKKNKTTIKYKRRLIKNMAKRKRSSRRSSFGTSSNIMQTALGVGAYILYEGILEPKVASVIGSGQVLNVAELVAGVYLARKGGIVGNFGKAAIVINTYQLMQPYLAGIGSNIFN